MRRRVPGAASLALILAACATAKPAPPVGIPPVPPAAPPAATASAFERLPGWRDDDHAAAFTAFASVCGLSGEAAMAQACRRARALAPPDRDQARAFFEANFQPVDLPEAGTLTAYFAPEYEARPAPSGPFLAPLRGRPTRPEPYPARAAIEAWPAAGALVWMKPEELYMLQVQGSGVLAFPDGRRLKAGVAATNGQPYLAIGNPMREAGLLEPGDSSADAIRAWLAAHRGPEADAVMRLNPRYVFFTLAPDDGSPPKGSAGVPLPAGRAIAVDRSRHAMGDLFWIDADAPLLTGARPSYRRLAVALDTGGAIKGLVRADLYLGQGDAAGVEAGRVRHQLRMFRLAPNPAGNSP